MCGRFNITSDPMTELFMDLVGEPYPGTTNLNTAPRQKAWVIREEEGERSSLEAQWWLVPNWAKENSSKYSMFNARRENLVKSFAFRKPYQSQRCVVPVTGFYEWVDRNGEKQPYYVHAPDHNGLLLAGLWERWFDQDAESDLYSFTIITTQVTSALKFLHRRQPAMLDKDSSREWLNQGTSRDQLWSLLDPKIPYDMVASPVSTYVNNVRNHGPECTEIIGDSVEIPAG